ncbi:capsule biosynthesis GfcC family protein [Macromonas bipunctata]|uniref:capsule biosynthesis GfcC family protein n=1 Tax=Macromonas bipunctata TaxID=183670 RepID=UPI000C34870E|nr:capsule biosynthesis GfcC family protein [Macromonas bipunctata]
MGAVLAETAFMHRASDTVGDYLDRAGITRDADLDGLMIIRANGSVESAARSNARTLWGMGSGLQSQAVFPGDTIFVPEKVDRRSGYSRFVEGAKDWTSILYQFGLGAAALKTINNIN